MKNVGLSEAYRQGMRAKQYDNPYDRNTVEFNDFERGWSQRVKRGGSAFFYPVSDCAYSLSQMYAPKVATKQSLNLGKYESYADAKGK